MEGPEADFFGVDCVSGGGGMGACEEGETDGFFGVWVGRHCDMVVEL